MLDFVTIVCILISLFGVFSQVTLDCEQKKKEIAVRKVNGAEASDIMRMFFAGNLRLLHPHSVRHLKIAGKSVPVEVISGVVGFFLLYLIVTTVGTIVLTVQDMDLVSAFTATLTCISNVGPGLGSVGPVDNFSHVPTLSKWVLTLCMLLGRLEIYAILVLFIPEFWRD